MADSNCDKWFTDVEEVIKEPLKFKAKLAIGEDAYASLRLQKTVKEVWDVAGAAGTGVWVAKLSAVASVLGSKGILVSLGITTASTPLGWVIAAGVLSGGAWCGITRYLKRLDQDKVVVIPQFINTPLDVLALELFELIAPLALKIANVDDRIDDAEKQVIRSYFFNQWGYDQLFVEKGIEFVESRLSEYTIKDTAKSLAEFQKQNPDCNYKSMSKEIISFISAIIESDGKVDEREGMAVEKVKNIFEEVGRINFKKKTKKRFEQIEETMRDSAGKIVTRTGKAIDNSIDLASDACDVMKSQGEKAADIVNVACGTVKAAAKKFVC